MKTTEAAKALDVNPDLIYVDAAHDEQNVYQDVITWYKKLNKNGVMCGDDWYWESVRKGVIKASKELNIKIYTNGGFWSFDPKTN